MYLIFQDIPEGDIDWSQPTNTSKRLMTFGSVDVNIEKKIRFYRFQVLMSKAMKTKGVVRVRRLADDPN